MCSWRGDTFFFPWDRVSYSTGWSQTCYVAKDSFELLILLALPPKCWESRHHPLFTFLRSISWGNLFLCKVKVTLKLECKPGEQILAIRGNGMALFLNVRSRNKTWIVERWTLPRSRVKWSPPKKTQMPWLKVAHTKSLGHPHLNS